MYYQEFLSPLTSGLILASIFYLRIRLVPDDTLQMITILKAFHHKAARQITRMTAKHSAGGEWEYPSAEEAMDSVGLHPIGVYIKRR